MDWFKCEKYTSTLHSINMQVFNGKRNSVYQVKLKTNLQWLQLMMTDLLRKTKCMRYKEIRLISCYNTSQYSRFFSWLDKNFTTLFCSFWLLSGRRTIDRFPLCEQFTLPFHLLSLFGDSLLLSTIIEQREHTILVNDDKISVHWIYVGTQGCKFCINHSGF